MTDFFRDSFTGTGDLSTHAPDVGGAYTQYLGSSGLLSDMVLDGVGNLQPTQPTNEPYAVSTTVGSPGNTYTLSETFKVTLAGNANANFDLAARLAAGDHWLVEAYLSREDDGGGFIWDFVATVVDSAGTTLYNNVSDVSALMGVGVEHTVTAEVSPSGVVWKIDGTMVDSTAFVPDVPPDTVVFANYTSDPALSYVLLSEILLGPSGATFPTGWADRDNADRVVLVEMDYVAEVAGAPVTKTLYLSDKGYIKGSQPYIDCMQLETGAALSRSLTGPLLASYSSSYGTLDIDNADGVNDFILSLACDGSQIRFYLGDATWDRSAFVLIFTALVSKVAATTFDKITVTLKDSSLLLNQSIGGTILVGGVGPDANKARPINVGWIHNMQALVLDSSLLSYVHSDTGVFTTVPDVRDRGVSVGFTDHGDGTFSLVTAPAGVITCDVVGIPDGGIDANRALSDLMHALIGVRAGMLAKNLYAGAGPTFTVHDADDYLLGISIQDQKNCVEILNMLVDSGNCFWSIRRDLLFTFGRLRPHDIASLGLTPVEINYDDIDDGTFQLDHALPQYYQFQAYMSRNWLQQTDFAGILTPDEQEVYRRNGIYLLQDPAVGTYYADRPELYDLTLTVSPAIDTLISGAFGELDLPYLATWMETRRAMSLPWIQTITVQVGIEFYELELGDVVNLNLTDTSGRVRFGCDASTLFQVIGIDYFLTKAKMVLRLVRRLLVEPLPPDWVRVVDSADDTALHTALAITAPLPPPPIVTVPSPGDGGGGGGGGPGGGIIYPVPAPGYPSIIPHYPIALGGASVGSLILSFNKLPGLGGGCVRRSIGSAHDFLNTAGAGQTFPESRVAFTSDGKYCVVGDPSHNAGAGNTGAVYVFKFSGGVYTQIALLTPTGSFTGWGFGVDISDTYTIVATNSPQTRWDYFLSTGTDTWGAGTTHSVTGSNSPRIRISRDTNVILVTDNSQIHAYTWASGSYNSAQVMSSVPGGIYTSMDLSIDGRTVVGNTSNNSGTTKVVDVWYSSNLAFGGGGTWNNTQSFQVGAGDNPGPADVGQLFMDDIAVNAYASVILVGARDFTSAGNGDGAVYVVQLAGASYTVTARLEQNVSLASDDRYGAAVAVSDDGNFMVAGMEAQGASVFGYAFAINCVKDKRGAVNVVDTPTSADAFVLSNPHPATANSCFGAGVAVTADGSRIAVVGIDNASAGISTLRIFHP